MAPGCISLDLGEGVGPSTNSLPVTMELHGFQETLPVSLRTHKGLRTLPWLGLQEPAMGMSVEKDIFPTMESAFWLHASPGQTGFFAALSFHALEVLCHCPAASQCSLLDTLFDDCFCSCFVEKVSARCRWTAILKGYKNHFLKSVY